MNETKLRKEEKPYSDESKILETDPDVYSPQIENFPSMSR